MNRFASMIPCPNHCKGESCEFECDHFKTDRQIEVTVEYSVLPNRKIEGWQPVIEKVVCVSIDITKRVDEETIRLLEEDARRDYQETNDDYTFDAMEESGMSPGDFAR